MNPCPQQQQLDAQMGNNDEDEYLQILDAGEHMFDMFVADDEDLYAYLNNSNNCEEPSSSWMNTEDIEDVISRSLIPSSLDNLRTAQSVDQDCCCLSFVELHIKGAAGKDVSTGNEDNSDNESANAGRLTPTDDDHDAMSQ